MRVYLDHNATSPLCDAAKAAMIDAMQVVGNPSSVHAEGRAAKAIIEKARRQVATAFGADGADIIFTSGATEAASLVAAQKELMCGGIEHDAVLSTCSAVLDVDADGAVRPFTPELASVQLANSETGILQNLPDGLFACDATQGFGKIPVAFNWMGATCAMISAHKLGGPKGVGALVVKRGTDIAAQIRGGGQEMGRRSGTENIIGIAGFGAAAEAAQADIEAGLWQKTEKLRNILENTIAQSTNKTIFVGKSVQRLPNTSCIVTPGWKGETQVMQLDLAGFAISAGSACSSGKVKASRTLTSMGFSEEDAACAIRVSLGPTTTEEEVLRFAESWIAKFERHFARRSA